MWFVAQWLRVAKQIDDSGQLALIQSDVAAIRAAQGQPGDDGQPQVIAYPLEDPVAETLYAEARVAMDAGLTRSALLTAGVALEHSLRTFAERNDVFDAKRLAGGKLLERMRNLIDPTVAAELQALWKVRNAVTHLRDDPAIETSRASALLDNFGWAISFLSAAKRQGY